MGGVHNDEDDAEEDDDEEGVAAQAISHQTAGVQ